VLARERLQALLAGGAEQETNIASTRAETMLVSAFPWKCGDASV
jgi:hypothetical protein